MADWIGRTLSKVEIQKLLGRGATAEVYLGRHTTLNRPVAVKVLHSFLSADGSLLQRFRGEAQAVAALRHPNIVQVFDFDTAEDHPYIVMELLEGPSLAEYLQALRRTGGRLPLAIIARLAAGLAGALDYAHGRGLIHRDVKPANVVLRSERGALASGEPLPADVEPVLTDFGVARLANATTQTASGLISGTPAYMSPEQARGEVVDARSDIYSLGVMLYEMLAGQPPFDAADETAASLLVKHITMPPPPIPGLSPQLQVVVSRALAKDRDERYQKAGDLAAELMSAMDLTPSTRPTWSRALPPTWTSAQSPRSGSGARWPLAAVTGLIVILIAVALIFRPKLLPATPGGNATGTGSNGAPTTGAGGGAGAQEFGTAGIRDGSAENDEITVAAINLPPLKPGTQYQGWLVGQNGESRHSVGVLTPNAQGQAQIIFVDEDGHNLLAEFDSFEITVEPNPDPSPNPSDAAVFSSVLPPQALVHIRHLLVSFDKTPEKIGLTIGLLRDARELDDAAQAMLAAQQAGDLAQMKALAEGIVNLIEGDNGTSFGDLDGDGSVTNPGDGFGLLLNGENVGYIEGTLQHARLGSRTPDATEHIQFHAGHVVVAAQDVEKWAVQLRDLALQIAVASDPVKAQQIVRQAAELADRLLRGQDLNGNETIDPLPDEAGALTAYQHAQYMADMLILPGLNQIPTPAPTAGSSTPLPTDAGDYDY